MGYRDETVPAAPEITPADAGCWLDGAMGWHNTYRVIERAQAYGFVLPNGAEDEDTIERYKEDSFDPDAGECVMEISNEATDYLQSKAPAGYYFVWDMGELSLVHEDEMED